MVKRVVAAIPATVRFTRGRLEVNEASVAEPYLPGRHERPTCGPFEVHEGEVFVLGDNRFASLGSCDWGPIPIADVVGRVAYVSPSWVVGASARQ